MDKSHIVILLVLISSEWRGIVGGICSVEPFLFRSQVEVYDLYIYRLINLLLLPRTRSDSVLERQ